MPNTLIFYFLCCCKSHILHDPHRVSDRGERHVKEFASQIARELDRQPNLRTRGIAVYHAPGDSSIMADALRQHLSGLIDAKNALVCRSAPWGAEKHILGYLLVNGSPLMMEDVPIGIAIFVQDEDSTEQLVRGYGGANTFNMTSGTFFVGVYPEGLIRKELR